jgi:[acyl-carrier-protein] S-malonyltransferase
MRLVGVVAVFPGQGSHAPGMHLPHAGHPVLARGVELLGRDPFATLETGTLDQQPAIFLVSVAAWDECGLRPAAAAGHSLGEYAALHAAGVLAFEDALRLVDVRARAMHEAPPGGMVALLGPSFEEARGVAEAHGLVVANDNAPGQVVLSGPRAGIEAVAASQRRARILPVSGAFHSPLMAGAADALRDALADVELGEPAFPVWSNGTARPFADVRAELVHNLLAPVRWRETVLALDGHEFAEVGPGDVLAGLIRRTLRSAASTVR